MNQALIQRVAQKGALGKVPEISSGMTVQVSQKIVEGDKERIQKFEGLVIATRGGTGINSTFTVLKIIDGIGVEKVFPLHAKTVTEIKVFKQAKTRRSKLYHMRTRRGKAARMQEAHVRESLEAPEPEKTAVVDKEEIQPAKQ
jgi:large subunit ribosomal protein L19